MAMVEAKFGLLQVPVESRPGGSVELGQSAFGETPERFNPVDMVGFANELVLTMVDPEMFIKLHFAQAIRPSPSVGVNKTLRICLPLDDRLDNHLARIGNDFRVDPIAAFQKSEDDRFATGAAAPFAPYPMRTEVGLVSFQGSDQGRLSFAGFLKPLPDPRKIALTVRTKSPVKADGLSPSDPWRSIAQDGGNSPWRFSKT